MTRKQKIIIGSVLVGTVTAYLIINHFKKKKEIQLVNDILDAKVSSPGSSGQKIITPAAYTALPNGNFPLKIGDKSKKVYDLQQALNRNYGTNVDVDGSFGQGLYKALCDKYFNYGCTVAGVPIYTRKVEQSDYDAILSHKN